MKLKERFNKLRGKIIITVVGVVALLQVQILPVFADVNGGLTTAKNNVLNQAKPVINTVAVPIILAALVGVLAVAIFRAVVSYRKGQEVEFGGIVLLFIGIILVATFPVWGWALIA